MEDTLGTQTCDLDTVGSTSVVFNFERVKVTLVQTLRLYTGRTAHRGSRGIAQLFHDQRHQKGMKGQRHAPAAIYPRERPGTHFTGGWVGPRAGLDRCGKFRPHRDSIPGLSKFITLLQQKTTLSVHRIGRVQVLCRPIQSDSGGIIQEVSVSGFARKNFVNTYFENCGWLPKWCCSNLTNKISVT